jgi:hypothetical protein
MGERLDGRKDRPGGDFPKMDAWDSGKERLGGRTSSFNACSQVPTSTSGSLFFWSFLSNIVVLDRLRPQLLIICSTPAYRYNGPLLLQTTVRGSRRPFGITNRCGDDMDLEVWGKLKGVARSRPGHSVHPRRMRRALALPALPCPLGTPWTAVNRRTCIDAERGVA